VEKKTPSYSPRALRKNPSGENSSSYFPSTISLDIDKRFTDITAISEFSSEENALFKNMHAAN